MYASSSTRRMALIKALLRAGSSKCASRSRISAGRFVGRIGAPRAAERSGRRSSLHAGVARRCWTSARTKSSSPLEGARAALPSRESTRSRQASRIAKMVAQGLSNREIAQSLFVTLRTVEMHLSNAFRKLDISARTQLGRALAASPGGPDPAPPG